MKKIIALSIIVLALCSFAFADDAKVMPKLVGRIYVAPIFAFVPGGYDEDGKYENNDDGSTKLFNLGFAIEYGVIDWITAAIKWAPGWTIWSDLEAASGQADTNMNGVADLFAGAKFQIIGEKAPVQNDMFRFAISLGVITPLPGPDFEEEAINYGAVKKATIAPMDKHVFAAGARVHFDWVINEHFFINLYNETKIYPIKQDLSKTGVAGYLQNTGLGGNVEVKYKYSLTFELEPVFSTSITDGLSFTAGLPVTYSYNPAPEYSGAPQAALNAAGLGDPDTSHLISVWPGVSFFLTKTPLPLEFKFQYSLPIWGKNASAQHMATMQIRAYFALPGAM